MLPYSESDRLDQTIDNKLFLMTNFFHLVTAVFGRDVSLSFV